MIYNVAPENRREMRDLVSSVIDGMLIPRKILSLIVLNRIERAVENFTGPFQAAYKAGKSCADLFWAQSMLISVVMKKEFEWNKVSIDMSAAFNTIRRGTTIRLLEAAGCSRDDLRLVQYLMANTTLVVRVCSTDSEMFSFNIGASQGDSTAGKLFTLNLAGAVVHIRAVLPSRPNPPIADNHMPLKSGYSDDVKKIGEDMEELQDIFQISKNILSEWSLFVNDTKTKFTRVYLEEVGACDEWDNELRGKEEWRNETLLGTKLGSEQDVTNRINKANTAFWSFDKLWCQGSERSQITEKRKIKLYDSLVVSVLLYNCCCWAAFGDDKDLHDGNSNSGRFVTVVNDFSGRKADGLRRFAPKASKINRKKFPERKLNYGFGSDSDFENDV
ncbi:uncharacterized protein LOC134826737 [Bolinopsis microptera]|uniref:uncharacterized protein LOC134826737 n=1 Tax=Bolinopsis microptera TaxID=2820187 RepID=UPI00307ADC0C